MQGHFLMLWHLGLLFPYEEELAHEANEFLSIESLQKMTEIFVKGLYKLMTEYR